jgi:ureidoglycolate lyase
MPDTDDAWMTTRFVEPDDLRHDMHVNVVSFMPGGNIPFAETHVMEHGLYVLEGKAVYRLNNDWVEEEAFKPFGDVIKLGTVTPKLINMDKCRRYSDLADIDVVDGEAGVSLFHADIRALPYELNLLERHPLGSQCFIPMDQSEYVVIVAEDTDGVPQEPVAFFADSTQSVNIARNTWHGVLTPVGGSGLFAVVDRIGDGSNLEECNLEKPFLVKK